MALVDHVLARKGRQVWTIAPNDSVHQAIELMAAKDIGSAVVVDGDRVVGMFTERLYARHIGLHERASSTTPVGEVMQANPAKVRPEHHLGACIDAMERQRVRHVPVVAEDGALVGLVSMGDVLRTIIAEKNFDTSSLVKYITRTR